jgi:hypothetical protein
MPAELSLRAAIVLSSTEESCTAVVAGQREEVRFADFFPRPRVERVAPGHLVALSRAEDGSETVVWRWFDAVVLDATADLVSLWEPGHGAVWAQRRPAHHDYRPGGRAYLSAGLPGAEWWVAGVAVDRGEQADVELGDVGRFLVELRL